MKAKILADIAPSVHPTKDILQLQGLIKWVFELSFTASGGSPRLLAEGAPVLIAKKRDCVRQVLQSGAAGQAG